MFLAVGIGITPFLSIVRQADRDRLSHKSYLFYSNGRPETLIDSAFQPSLRAMLCIPSSPSEVPTGPIAAEQANANDGSFENEAGH
jgi:NAD(P)H-flavin reductase